MEKYYAVEFTVHNAKSSAWLSQISGGDKDKDVAKAFYHSECARLWNSADFDFVCVLLKDNYGNVLVSDSRDSRVAPEPNEGE